MTTLRLILGDQLHYNHSWFSAADGKVVYLMAELRQELTYTKHHIQKVAAFFLAMRQFRTYLENEGHRILYYALDHPENPGNLTQLLENTIQHNKITRFEYQLPDEYRLDEQLRSFCNELEIPSQAVSSEHFLTSRDTLKSFFEGKKSILMEPFYRMMRKKFNILIDDDGKPAGGKWNYDHQNRNAWKGQPQIPPLPESDHNFKAIADSLEKAGIQTLGDPADYQLNWPVNRKESLALLAHFTTHLLPWFGKFQDAMHEADPFLFHSRLSFALNTKMLHPMEVIRSVLNAYESVEEPEVLAQVEGFIRQVLGWREFMRGVYWREMPGYLTTNYFSHDRPLPNFYWSGKTEMNCLKHSITQSLETAYAHHIQRLMITGNFALLYGASPDAVDQWYLGIYIDAVQWVEITNTRGMSQYADGGLIASKPYVSSANYISKMSNYCTSCKYNPKLRLGKNACPFNALYWSFLSQHETLLRTNPRMRMMYRLLDKIDENELDQMKVRAASIKAAPDSF